MSISRGEIDLHSLNSFQKLRCISRGPRHILSGHFLLELQLLALAVGGMIYHTTG